MDKTGKFINTQESNILDGNLSEAYENCNKQDQLIGVSFSETSEIKLNEIEEHVKRKSIDLELAPSRSHAYNSELKYYYDVETGYHYDPDSKLYFNSNDGFYYKLDPKSNKLQIHCQLEIQHGNTNENNKDTNNDDKEEGELTDSNNEFEDLEKRDLVTFIKEIREAAENAEITNSYVFEPKSGLYYHRTSGYYYDAENGLYYNGDTGHYYKLNTQNNEFELYSDLLTSPDADDSNMIENPQKRKLAFSSVSLMNETYNDNKVSIINDSNDKCEFDSENDSNYYRYSNIIQNNSNTDNYEDPSEFHASCLRLIVQETDLQNLRVGTLFIITCTGGTLGREGKDHNIIVPDPNVSKYHLKFEYDDNNEIYQCIDLGSRNGTVLNGKRMSSAKQESEPHAIKHGSIIQLSKTKLLCHIHTGSRTCNDCEPGCVMEVSNTNLPSTLSHKEQLKKLKKRYGLNIKEHDAKTRSDKKYKDRAETRRQTIGSSNEYGKTQMSSTETAISDDNKGFKMLEKLGWKKGQVLGKDESGIKTPIDLQTNEGTKGFGYKDNSDGAMLNYSNNSKRNEKWKKAQQRYKN